MSGVGEERAHFVQSIVLMQGLLGPPTDTAPGSWVLGMGYCGRQGGREQLRGA